MTRKQYEIKGLSLVVLDDGRGESALGNLTMAERFLEAAEKLVFQEGFLPTAGDPESLLTGHALELALKSFLIARGVSTDELKNRIRHNLKRCLQKAEDKGICKIAPVSPALRGGVDLLSNEYSGKHLEYFRGTGILVRPDLREFLPEIRNVCEALEAVYVDVLKEGD